MFFKPSVTKFLFGLFNICSVSGKVDDLLDVQCDHRIDVQCLTETWHDTDCVAFSRLRLDGYSIVDGPRPRTSAASLKKTNHGGLAVIAKPGINVSAVSTVSDVPATFEYVCARVKPSSPSSTAQARMPLRRGSLTNYLACLTY